MLLLLELLLYSHRDHAAEEALETVAGTRETASGGNLVLVGCMLIEDVLHHDRNADVPQVLVRGPVSGVVSQRQIERVEARLVVRIVRDQAWVRVGRSPANLAAG